MKLSSVQRRVRDSSGGSEGSGILVDIQTEGNTWLGGTVLYTMEMYRIGNRECS